jgi:hypothetical protein
MKMDNQTFRRDEMQLDTRKLENVVMADVQMFDFPDFVDAYVEYAEINGVELTDAQYDEVNENYEFLQQSAYESLY